MQYSALVSVYSALAATTKRLEKTKLVADLLTATSDADLEPVVLLLQGRVFPRWDKQTLGVSSKLAAKAIALTAGISEQKVHDLWRKHGDLGKVTAELLGKKRQATLLSRDLSVKEVFEKLRKLPGIEGVGSVDLKLKSIGSLLASATPEEAQYLLRTVLEELRVGVAEGTLRDAISLFFIRHHYPDMYQVISTLPKEKDSDTEPFLETHFPKSGPTYEKTQKDFGVSTYRELRQKLDPLIQAAYDRSNDYAIVARAAKHGREALGKIELEVGKPVRVMLAQREISIPSIFDHLGRPCAFEYKYDGFRMQVHKKNDEVLLFTRRLEPVTEQFPEVVKAVREHIMTSSCILDAEAVGYDPKKGTYTPFQAISQRIRRKYEILRLVEELPVELNLFDVIYYEGRTLLDIPYAERRTILKKALPKGVARVIRLSEQIVTADEQYAEAFYKASLTAGNEGVMAKNLEGTYRPGARVGHMVKLKPALDTMDLVVVGAEWGEGKRSGWFTSFTLACADPLDDDLLTIGKVGTGLKEIDSEDPDAVTFDKLTKLLEVIEQHGREVLVRSTIVLEIKFEEIQASPTYGSGFALRFPRVVRLREDRGADDITTIDEVRSAAKVQRGRT